MAILNDIDAGLHKAQRRFYLLTPNDTQLVNQNIPAAGFADSVELAAVAYENFNGQIVANTPAATTLEVRVIPRALYSSGGLFSDDEFTVATIVTGAAGFQRYSFAWGVGRGLILSATGTGGTFLYSAVFKIRVRNTGLNVANTVSLEGIACV